MAENRYTDDKYEFNITEHDRLGRDAWDAKVRREQQEQRWQEEELQQMLLSPAARRAQANKEPRPSSSSKIRPGSSYLALLRECGPFLLLLFFAPRITESIPFSTYQGHVWFELSYWIALGLTLLPLVFFTIWLRRMERHVWLRLAVVCLPLEAYFTLHLCQRVPWMLLLLLFGAAGLAALLHIFFQGSHHANGPPPPEVISAAEAERIQEEKPRVFVRRERNRDGSGSHQLFRAMVISFASFLLIPAVIGAVFGPIGQEIQGDYPIKEVVTPPDDTLNKQLHRALQLLTEKYWEDLSLEEKQQAFQTILDAEARESEKSARTERTYTFDFKDLQDIKDFHRFTLRRALRSHPDEYEARLRVVICVARYEFWDEEYGKIPPDEDVKSKDEDAREYVGGRVKGYAQFMKQWEFETGE